MNWTADQIPNQNGKIVIVTGGNTGLGYQMSLELANKNAHVVIACRSVSKGNKAIQHIKDTLKKNVSLETIPLDLTDLTSIKAFADVFLKKHNQLNILINNAGVVNLKNRQESGSGIEMHMATNHFGHFALTGYLFSMLVKTPNARVVTMSSGAYRSGAIDFKDTNWETRPYHRANLMAIASSPIYCLCKNSRRNLIFIMPLPFH